MILFILLSLTLCAASILKASEIDTKGSAVSRFPVKPSTFIEEAITSPETLITTSTYVLQGKIPQSQGTTQESEPGNLALPSPAGWFTVISDELSREVSKKVSRAAERYADNLLDIPLPTNLAVVVSGFVSHKLARVLWVSLVTYLPPAFLALESLAQLGYIGDKNEGIIDWARESNLTSTLENRFGQGDLLTASDARPYIQLAVDFFLDRLLIFLLGFVMAFLI